MVVTEGTAITATRDSEVLRFTEGWRYGVLRALITGTV